MQQFQCYKVLRSVRQITNFAKVKSKNKISVSEKCQLFSKHDVTESPMNLSPITGEIKIPKPALANFLVYCARRTLFYWDITRALASSFVFTQRFF